MKYTEDSARLWCREDGSIKQPGDPWANPAFAETLERLARAGARDFYAGELAARIASEIERGGGYVTLGDLRTYETRLSDPVAGTFCGLRVHSAAPPASGIACVQMLQVLDHFEPLQPETPRAYVLLASVMREAFAARLQSVADPDFVAVPVADLILPEWARAAAERINAHIAPEQVAGVGGEGTTHVSTYDTDGNAVAPTHTLGIFSGVIVPNTGITLNSGMDLFDPMPGGPNSIQPGKGRVSGMAPTIAFDGWRPAIVSGAPGTNAIVTSVVQVIVGLVDGKLSPVEAVSVPRVHCEGGPVFVEGRVGRASREALAGAGFDLRQMPGNYVPGMGRNQVIRIDARGQFRGASDPRRDGAVAVYSTS